MVGLHPWVMILVAMVLVGGVGFVLVLFAGVLFQFIGGVLGGISRGLRGQPGRVEGLARANVARICPNRKCRHPNRTGARFCGQCGQRL